MKKISTTILLLFIFSLNCFSQNDIKSKLNNWRKYNKQHVISATIQHRISPKDVGNGIGDSLAVYIIMLYDSLNQKSIELQNKIDSLNKKTICGVEQKQNKIKILDVWYYTYKNKGKTRTLDSFHRFTTKLN